GITSSQRPPSVLFDLDVPFHVRGLDTQAVAAEPWRTGGVSAPGPSASTWPAGAASHRPGRAATISLPRLNISCALHVREFTVRGHAGMYTATARTPERAGQRSSRCSTATAGTTRRSYACR